MTNIFENIKIRKISKMIYIISDTIKYPYDENKNNFNFFIIAYIKNKIQNKYL